MAFWKRKTAAICAAACAALCFTAAVRPTVLSGPKRVMSSLPTASAPLPEKGRRNMSGAHSAGMPRKRRAGESSRASASGTPEARSIVTAVSSTTSGGRISITSRRPSFAPAHSAA